MKYFGFLILGWVLACAAYLGWFGASLGFSSSLNTANIAGWYAAKDEAMARRAGEPRLVLFGGSSGLYGVRMEMVEAELGIPAVNFAVHAGLPMRYLLHRLKAQLQPGDTLLFAPEYEFYHPRNETGVIADYVIGADPDYLQHMPVKRTLEWAFGADGNRLWDTVRRWIPHDRDYARAVFDNGVKSLNAHGDQLQNELHMRAPAREQNLKNSEPLRSLRPGLTENAAWNEIEAFLAWCRERDIRVIAMFPPTVYFPEYDDPEIAALLEDLIAKWHSLGVPTLNTPRDAMLPMDMFFDTSYHLNSDGTRQFTESVIGQLRVQQSQQDF